MKSHQNKQKATYRCAFLVFSAAFLYVFFFLIFQSYSMILHTQNHYFNLFFFLFKVIASIEILVLKALAHSGVLVLFPFNA